MPYYEECVVTDELRRYEALKLAVTHSDDVNVTVRLAKAFEDYLRTQSSPDVGTIKNSDAIYYIPAIQSSGEKIPEDYTTIEEFESDMAALDPRMREANERAEQARTYDTYVPAIMSDDPKNIEWIVCNYLDADDIRFRGSFAECEQYLAIPSLRRER